MELPWLDGVVPANQPQRLPVVLSRTEVTPIVIMEAPRTVTMNTGSRLWISSEDMSMNSEPKPKARMPVGKARHFAGVALQAWEPPEGGVFMCEADPSNEQYQPRPSRYSRSIATPAMPLPSCVLPVFRRNNTSPL